MTSEKNSYLIIERSTSFKKYLINLAELGDNDFQVNPSEFNINLLYKTI
jgi:hypothetical protein